MSQQETARGPGTSEPKPRAATATAGMSSPALPKRVVGQVTRWGSLGYGFIACPELPRDAWCHVRFIVDPWFDLTRPLPVGLEVEFQPHVVPDGKIQAHSVTRPGKFREPESKTTFATIGDRLAASPRAKPLAIARPAALVPTAAPGVVTPGRAGPGPQPLSEKVEGARQRAAAEEKSLEREEARLREGAEQVVAQRAAAAKDFDERVAQLARERERKLADLDENARKDRAEAEALKVKREALGPASAEGLARLVREEMARARTAFSERIGRRASSQADVAKARAAAIASAGEAAVRKYEEARRRRDAATDPTEREFLDFAERGLRPPIEAYGRALDQAGGGAQLANVTLFTSARDSGRLVAVVPLEPADLDGNDFRWRLGACLLDAAERVAPELDSSIGIGTVSGSLAVELRPWSVEADLFEVALREAWDARPALAAASLALAVDVVPELEPTFELVVLEEPAPPANAPRNDLRAVAKRLELNLPDLIASLRASGLPMRDDAVDDGFEESLRELLKGPAPHEAPPSSSTPPHPGASQPTAAAAPSSARVIASRVLGKLVRDRRFGSRSTNEASVWGHHFADNEKAPARELVRRFKRMGIFLSKTGDTVSIDPRRMDDVHRIIQMTWNEPGLFDGLE